MSPDARVSMNLWGFTPAFHKTLQVAMAAATEASEESEVLLPEVVAESLDSSPFTVLAASGRCIGVTHPDDLALVQDELAHQVSQGERPATSVDAGRGRRRLIRVHLAWHRVGSRLRAIAQGLAHMGPDATQPRVTVRPKPPVLLGATSETHRRHRSGIVSDNPLPGLVRQLQGSRHSVTRYVFRRKLHPAPAASPLRNSMPTLDPALRLSLGHLPVHLAASLPASLRPALRRFVGVRRAFISELVQPCSSSGGRSMRFREIQTFSPPFPQSSPTGSRESPTLPHPLCDGRTFEGGTGCRWPPHAAG